MLGYLINKSHFKGMPWWTTDLKMVFSGTQVISSQKTAKEISLFAVYYLLMFSKLLFKTFLIALFFFIRTSKIELEACCS